MPTKPKTWAVGEIPKPREMEDYLAWISAVRDAFQNVGGFPELPPNMDGLTFEKANDIERVLLIADRTFDNMKKSRVFSGELQSGGV